MKKNCSLILRLGNTIPADGRTDDTSFIETWRELSKFFGTQRLISFSDDSANKFYFTLDVSDALSLIDIDSATEDGESLLKDRMESRKNIGAGLLSCDILINIRCIGKSIETLNTQKAVYRFLQQLFVTMNIAFPGSMSMHFSSFLENKLDLKVPDLSGNLLEFSYQTAIKDGWPKVSTCSVADTWAWLHKQRFYEIDWAETPAIKAAFALIALGFHEDFEESNILTISRALEALFTDGGDSIQKILRQRVNLVLGEPSENKKWLTTFYELRSAIAHGRKMLRPLALKYNGDATLDSVMYAYSISAERAIAVLIAILQDFVRTNSKEYQFSHKYKRTRI